MQPPTRWARRNGSGIAPGRKRGGTDGASAGKADGAGRGKGRPNKNPGRRTRTGLQEAGRRRCHQGFGCHRRRERGQHFCRGSEPNVHRFDCPGGGPFCAACCRAWFSHSRLQETSAGRNLITLFMTVNNPAYFFFRPLARNAAPTPPRARFENARAHRRVRRAFLSTSLKPKRGAAFSALAFFVRGFSDARASRAKRVAKDSDGLYRKKKFLSATAADFASHKPDCAKVRELFSAASGARDRRDGARRGRARRSRRDRGARTRPTATRRCASARGAADTTVRRSRMPTRASRAHRVRTRTSALETFLPVGENSSAGGQRRSAFAEPASANRTSRSTRSRRAVASMQSASRQAPRESGGTTHRIAATRRVGALRRLVLHRACTPERRHRARPDRCRSRSPRRGRPRARKPFALRATSPRATRWRSRGARRGPNRRDENRRGFSRFARARMHRRTPARSALDAPRRADAGCGRPIGSCWKRSRSRAAGTSRMPLRPPRAALIGGPARRPNVRRGRRVRPRRAAMPLRIRTSRSDFVSTRAARSRPHRTRRRTASPQTKRGASPGHRDRGPVLRSPWTAAGAGRGG